MNLLCVVCAIGFCVLRAFILQASLDPPDIVLGLFVLTPSRDSLFSLPNLAL